MGPFGWPFRFASAVMGLLFFFAVVVQYNDPDPIVWMATYGAASLLSLLTAMRPLPPLVTGVPAGAAFLWAASLMPVVLFGRTSFAEMFRTYEMMSPQMEEGREMLGLIIVAAWLGGLTLRARLRRRPAEPPEPAPAPPAPAP